MIPERYSQLEIALVLRAILLSDISCVVCVDSIFLSLRIYADASLAAAARKEMTLTVGFQYPRIGSTGIAFADLGC